MHKLETTVSPAVTFAVVAVGIIALAQLLSTIASTSPATASNQETLTVFISLFFSLSSFFTFTWYGLQKNFMKRWVVKPNFKRCLRQAALTSFLIVSALFLNSINVFQVWDILPLLLAGILVEFFFQAEKKPHASLRHAAQEIE